MLLHFLQFLFRGTWPLKLTVNKFSCYLYSNQCCHSNFKSFLGFFNVPNEFFSSMKGLYQFCQGQPKLKLGWVGIILNKYQPDPSRPGIVLSSQNRTQLIKRKLLVYISRPQKTFLTWSCQAQAKPQLKLGWVGINLNKYRPDQTWPGIVLSRQKGT